MTSILGDTPISVVGHTVVGCTGSVSGDLRLSDGRVGTLYRVIGGKKGVDLPGGLCNVIRGNVLAIGSKLRGRGYQFSMDVRGVGGIGGLLSGSLVSYSEVVNDPAVHAEHRNSDVHLGGHKYAGSVGGLFARGGVPPCVHSRVPIVSSRGNMV